LLKTGLQAIDKIREPELTPAEARETLLQLSRQKITESGARPAINTLGKIMCDAVASASPQPRGMHDRNRN